MSWPWSKRTLLASVETADAAELKRRQDALAEVHLTDTRKRILARWKAAEAVRAATPRRRLLRMASHD